MLNKNIEVNLALNKNAILSSNGKNNLTANYAVDGKNTRWYYSY